MKIQLQKRTSFYFAVLAFLMVNLGWGQTPYVMSGGNYSETFTNIANTTNWPNNFNGTDCTEWGSVAVNASGTVGDGVRITVSSATFTTTTTSSGVQRGTNSINFLSSSTANSVAIDLFLDFTNRNAGTVSFDVATVFNSTGDRDSKLRLFYSTNGTTWTELTATNLPYTARNNVAGNASISVNLPNDFNNSATARLRFYEHSTTSGATPTGSQPKISIDNIIVTSTSTSGAPSISSPTAASISNTSAVLGANITSDGGSSIINRGTVFKTSSPVTISDNYLSEGGTSAGVFTHTRSSLTPQTLYYYAGYGTNSSGTTLSSESSFRTLSNPPTAQATNLAGVLTSNTAADLSWTAATFPSSGATIKGYVLLRATSPNTPSLSNANGAAPVAGANTTIVSATISELSLLQSNTGLTANTTYNYMLIPYTWDGTNVSTYNYLFASAPTAVVNTPSNLSDVVAVASSESVTISSLMNDAAPLTSSTGVQVWQFTVRDGGSTLNDTDNLPTVVTGFTLTQNSGNAIDNWLDAIKTIALFDGTSLIATPTSITATTIVFSGLNLSVTDNFSKTFSLRLSLNETLNNIGSGNLDNDDFVFNITNANFSTLSDGTSSTKASFSTASSTNGQNAVSVVASKLLFVQQPTNVSTNTSISPSVTVRAIDNGNNLDSNFVSSVSITATGSTLIGSPIAVNSVSGLATFSNLQFSTPATGVILQANSTGLTGVVSSSFDVTLPLSAYTYRTIRSGNWNQITSGNETWERTSDGTNWFPVSSSGDIPNNSAGSITVRNGHVVQVNTVTNVDELLVEANAQITIQSAQTLTIIDGTGTDATISGYIKNDGTFINNGQIIFNASSTYEHSNNISSSSIPLATWDSSSNLIITGVVSNLPTFSSSQTYGNVTWNCQSQSSTLNLVGNLRNIASNFIIQSTGTGILRLTGGTSATFTIGGNLEISNSSQLQVANAPSSGTPTYVLNIGGNFSQTGGTFNPNTGSYTCAINFTGLNKTFTQSGGTLTNTNINWTVSNGAYLSLSSDLPVATSRTLTVLGTLDCGTTYKISGAGAVTVSNGGVLKTSNLNTSGALNGSVTATGGLTLSTGSTVELNGTAPQFLGARTFSNLKINNASGVVAKGDLTVNGILDLSANPNATNGALEMVIDYTGYAQNPYGTGDYTNSTASFNNLNSYVLTMGPSAITVGIGDVTGKIRRTGLVDNTTYSFGNAHTELRLNSVSGSAIPSQITVVATRGAYGTHIDNTGGVAINGTTANRNAVERLYQILRTGGDVASRFTLRMAYEDGDLNGNTEANLVSWDHHLPYGAITPHEHGKTSANATENWVELSNHSVNYLATEGATTFTKYWMLSAKESLNDYEWLGAVAVPGQTNWNITENWKSGKIPNETANVFIPNTSETLHDPVIDTNSGYGILDGTTVTTGEVRMRTLEIASGGVLTVVSGAAPTITLYGGPNVGGGGINYGSWLNNGTFTAANSTVIFDFDNTATESTIAGSTSFYNVTIANAKKATLQEDAQVALAGTLTNGGILDATTNLNTVIFNGSTDQTVVATNGSDLAYYSLELGGTGVKSFATAPSIKGDFIQSGSATITVPSVITFNGSAAQNIVGLNYSNIVFSEAGTKIFTSDGSISRAGAITFLGTPGTVDFDGASDNLTFVLKSDNSGTARIGNSTGWTLEGKVTAERYIPAKRGWRLLTAPLKGTSNTTVPNNWQGVAEEGLLLFSPSTYQSQTMTGYTTGGGSPNIWKYDSANTQWQSIPNLTAENLFTSTGNNGFLVFATGPSNSANIVTGEAVTTLRPQGQLITGAVSHSLTADKYHLIGNPYASAIDTEALVQANTNTKVFMVDPSLGTVGGYFTYDGSNWTPTPPSGSEKYIQSGQGFFVRSASNPTFTISESHKVVGTSNAWFDRVGSSSSTSSSTSTSTSSSVVEDKIRVLLYKQLNSQWQLADGILTVNSVDGNDGVDAVDTGKMTNFNENIAFRNGTSNLAIEYRGLPTTGTVQQMRLTGTTVQPYQLRVKTEHYSNSGLQPYLEDTQAGTFTLIPTDGSDVVVNFTGMAATSAAPDARFRIVYPSALGVDAPDALSVGVYPNPTEEGVFTILLPLAGETARYTLTNLVGQEVQQGTLDSVSSRVSVSSLQGGVYLLEVNQSGKRFATKLIIK